MKGSDWTGQTAMDVYVPNDVESYMEVILERLRAEQGHRMFFTHPNHYGADYSQLGLKEEQRALMEKFGLSDLEKFVKAVRSLYMRRLIVIHWSRQRISDNQLLTEIALTKKFLTTLKVEISK